MTHDGIRPTYDVEFDKVKNTWCVYRIERVPDGLIVEFNDKTTALGVCECMNDVMQRLWYDV